MIQQQQSIAVEELQQNHIDRSRNTHKEEVGDHVIPTRENLLICRYGAGCTHLMADPSHGLRYYHPPSNRNIRQKSFICNECGECFDQIESLRDHLQKKTAWSNKSLVGCRVCCLINNKEWHEGFVTQYHHSGRHYVHFVSHGEGIWLNMIMMTFHIVDKNNGSMQLGGECKDDSGDLWEKHEEFTFIESLSLDFTYAQSMLTQIYGLIETGHKTKGHVCISEAEMMAAKTMKDSFLYGELLPRGVNRALSASRLNAAAASVLFDLGMGTGKIPVQAFLQFKNLEFVYGIELSQARYKVAENAVLDLVRLLGESKFLIDRDPGRSLRIEELVHVGGSVCGSAHSNEDENELRRGRVLMIECGNMFDLRTINKADILMLETEIPPDLQPNLCYLLHNAKPGARTLTYLDLRQIWSSGPCPFKRLENNKLVSDRYSTSWSVQRGHHFYLWTRSSDILSDYQMRGRRRDGVGLNVIGALSYLFGSRTSSTSRTNSKDNEELSPEKCHRSNGKISPSQLRSQSTSTDSSSCLPALNIFTKKARRSGSTFADTIDGRKEVVIVGLGRQVDALDDGSFSAELMHIDSAELQKRHIRVRDAARSGRLGCMHAELGSPFRKQSSSLHNAESSSM